MTNGNHNHNRHDHSRLTRAQRTSLQALVDAFLPPILLDNDNVSSLSGRRLNEQQDDADSSRRHSAAYTAAAIEQRRRYWQHALSRDVYFLQTLEYMICYQMNPHDATLFKNLLTLLSTSIGTSLVFGRITFQPYYQLDNHIKTAFLQTMQQQCGSSSMMILFSMQQRRRREFIFCSLKRFICGMAYSYCKPMSITSSSSLSSTARIKRKQPQLASSSSSSLSSKSEYDEYDYSDNPHWAAMRYSMDINSHNSNNRYDPVDAQRVIRAQKAQAPIQQALLVSTYNTSTSKSTSSSTTPQQQQQQQQDLECDVLIIGSGAGGSMAASVLCPEQDVILVERGSYIPPIDIAATSEASTMNSMMYEQAGLLTNTDGTIHILAANTFGGGSTINWNACIPLPLHVRHEWATQYGLTDFFFNSSSSSLDSSNNATGANANATYCAFEESLQYISTRLAQACDDQVHHNVPNSMLQMACNKLGYSWHGVAQNLKDTLASSSSSSSTWGGGQQQHGDAGSVHLGDRYGNKQTSLTLFLNQALSASASTNSTSTTSSSAIPPPRLRILDNCHVDRIWTQPVSIVIPPPPPSTITQDNDKKKKKKKKKKKHETLFATQRATSVTCRRIIGQKGSSSSKNNNNIRSSMITITARKCIILAAGALQTPCILQRSGLAECNNNKNRHIGKHLYLHPTTAVTGLVSPMSLSSSSLSLPSSSSASSSSFSKKSSSPSSSVVSLNPWKGAIITIACTQFANNVDKNNGYGCLVECPASHPGLLATGLPWTSPQQFKDRLLRIQQALTLIIVQRDHPGPRSKSGIGGGGGGGSVRSTHDGQRLEIRYKLSKEDRASLLQGTLGAIRLLCACDGMEQVMSLNSRDRGLCLLPSNQQVNADDDSNNNSITKNKNQKLLDDYLLHLTHLGNTARPHDVTLFSAHQMGTCRMSTSPETGATDTQGELWNCQDLFIMDASLFPTATGVNPMLTVMTVAHMLAKRLALRLAWRDYYHKKQQLLQQQQSSSSPSSFHNQQQQNQQESSLSLSAQQARSAAALERQCLARRMTALQQDYHRRHSAIFRIIWRTIRNMILFWLLPIGILFWWLDLFTLLFT